MTSLRRHFKRFVVLITALAFFSLIFYSSSQKYQGLDKALYASVIEGLSETNLYQETENVILQEIVTGETNAKIYKLIIEHKEKKQTYLLKIFNPDEGKYIHVLSIALTQYADQNNIGPKFYYAPPNKKFMITEFFEGSPLTKKDAEHSEILKKIALALKKIHAFKSEKIKFIPYLYKINRRVNGLMAENAPLEPIFNQYYKNVLRFFYLINCHSQMTLIHNDFHNENFLYDGDKLAIFDWDNAGLQSPYFDIAFFFLSNNASNEAKNKFLTYYFEREPLKKEVAMSLLSEQIILYYSAIKNYQKFFKRGTEKHKKQALYYLTTFTDNLKKQAYKDAIKILEKS